MTELVRLNSKVWSAYQVENVLATVHRLIDELGLVCPPIFTDIEGDTWIVWTETYPHISTVMQLALTELNHFEPCPLCGAEHPQITCPLKAIM